jgi:O-antigen/teichoic acid export membrane protein
LELFIKLTYGIEFIGIVKFSVPLAMVTIFLPFANILLTTISQTGDPIKKMYARGLGLIVNLIFVYPLFLNYGAIGFVISIALGQFIIFLAALFFYRNRFNENNLNKLFIIKINDVKYLLKTIKKQIVFK